MDITPPRESAGTDRLRLLNRQESTVRATAPVEPYPRIAPTEQHIPSPAPERRQGERRQGERRKAQALVLLDTRIPHERRLQYRRAEEKAARAEGDLATGIDTTA